MQKSSKLELFYQIVRIHKFLKYARRSRVLKALPLDNLSGAVSAYYQRQTDTTDGPCSKSQVVSLYSEVLWFWGDSATGQGISTVKVCSGKKWWVSRTVSTVGQ